MEGKAKIFPYLLSQKGKVKQKLTEIGNEYECAAYGYSRYSSHEILKRLRLGFDNEALFCYFYEKELKLTDGASMYNPNIYKLRTVSLRSIDGRAVQLSRTCVNLFEKFMASASDEIFVRCRHTRHTDMRREQQTKELIRLGLKQLPREKETVKIGFKMFLLNDIEVSVYRLTGSDFLSKQHTYPSEELFFQENIALSGEGTSSYLVSIAGTAQTLDLITKTSDRVSEVMKRLSSFVEFTTRQEMGL